MSRKSKNTAADNKEKLENVVNELNKLDIELKETVLFFAKESTQDEIIKSFNQGALDTFDEIMRIIRIKGVESQYKISVYRDHFLKAVKVNYLLPIDKFTLVILEFALSIYKRDETLFLDMTIPDTQLDRKNEFSIIRSEEFKKLWKTLNDEQKTSIWDKVEDMTRNAHMYFYKTILSI
jgi:hypothetical protein